MTFGTKQMAYHDLLREVCGRVRELSGCAIEFGVYQGSSLALLCDELAPTHVYGLDTFTGLPEPGQYDLDLDNRFNDTDMPRVRKRLGDRANYTLLPGLFHQTLPALNVSEIKLSHIDCDYHDGYRQALEWTWPRLVRGGYVVCDDYEASMCPGARRAVNDWLTSRGDREAWVRKGRCVIRKTGGNNGN